MIDVIKFDELQRIGKALMLPVAVLPVAAILLRFGAIYYFVFNRAIVKFNLPTIGRVDEEISSGGELGDFAGKIVDGLGGMENLLDVQNCV